MRGWVVRVFGVVSFVAGSTALAAVPPANHCALSGDQQKAAMDKIKAAMAKIPDCWKNCDVGAPKVVMLDDCQGNAFFDGDSNTMMFNSGDFLPGNLAKDDANSRSWYCTPAGGSSANQTLFSPLERVITHELAHKAQFSCNPDGWKTLWGHNPLNKSNNSLVHDFLGLTYDKNYQALHKDPQFVTVRQQMRDLIKKMPLNPQDYAKWCGLQQQANALEKKYHMPQRFYGDSHAAEVTSDQNQEHGGAEYFAMAMEQLMWDPASFCSTFNDSEVAWLKKNFGDCLSKFPGGVKAPCYYPNAQSTGGNTPAQLHP